jgi:hypothetical protein
MKPKIVGSALSIDLGELVEGLDDDGKKELARQLVADDHLFAAVLECVAKGEYFADDERGAWWFSPSRVLELREKLLPLMPEIARDAVREALRQRNDAREEERRMWDWAWKLFHAWPSDRWAERPALPFVAGSCAPEPSDAEVSTLFGRGTKEAC